MVSCKDSTQVYCQKLEGIVSDSKVRDQLESWFDQNFKDKLTPKSDYRFGGVFIPGLYTYKGFYDWSILDFHINDSRIKMIGIHKEDIDSQGFVEVNKVFLGERSRVGILIKSSKSEDFDLGTDIQYVNEISDRIAVLCIDVGFF